MMVVRWSDPKESRYKLIKNRTKSTNKFLTATEFFISAITDVNSGKCNSGQYGIGKTKSPEVIPACIPQSSQSLSLLKKAL